MTVTVHPANMHVSHVSLFSFIGLAFLHVCVLFKRHYMNCKYYLAFDFASCLI